MRGAFAPSNHAGPGTVKNSHQGFRSLPTHDSSRALESSIESCSQASCERTEWGRRRAVLEASPGVPYDLSPCFAGQNSDVPPLGFRAGGAAQLATLGTPQLLMPCLSLSFHLDHPSIQRVSEILRCRALAPGAPALSVLHRV